VCPGACQRWCMWIICFCHYSPVSRGPVDAWLQGTMHTDSLTHALTSRTRPTTHCTGINIKTPTRLALQRQPSIAATIGRGAKEWRGSDPIRSDHTYCTRLDGAALHSSSSIMNHDDTLCCACSVPMPP
jgi:hypothetical protein